MFKCNRSLCERTFTFQNNRSRHQKTCTQGEIIKPVKERFVCVNEWCQKEFDKRSNRDRHVKVCKFKEKKYFECTQPFCLQKFDKPSKLERHLKVHVAKQVYICDTCSCSYIRKDKYEEHIKKCGNVENESEQSLTDPETNDIYDLSVGRITQCMDTLNVRPISPPFEEDIQFEVIPFEEAPPFEQVTIVEEPLFEEEPPHIPENPPVLILDEGVEMYYGDCETEVAACTFQALKKLKHDGKRSSVKLKKFTEACNMLFSKKKDDVGFMEYVSLKLGFDGIHEFIQLIDGEISVKKRGRPNSGMAERQLMFNYWLDNSELSNDRRNARHTVKIKPSKCSVSVTDLHDDNTTLCNTKRGPKLKAQRRIYSLPIRELYLNFKTKYPDVQCSFGAFYRCKPFYVVPASLREMEGCLCAKCLNPQVLYGVLRTFMKDMPISLTGYLTQYFECSEDRNISYPKVDCLNGTCKNECLITNESERSDVNWGRRVSYYQFEAVEETYFDKRGNQKSYTRIARKDYSVTLRDAYEKLQEMGGTYLLHRYHTLIDKIYWQRFLSETSAPVMWLDYSQNIKLTEKNQAQSAHFSGKQQTLHDSLIQWPDSSHSYIFHISDDTNHDSVLTNEIITQTVENHPDLIKNGRLALRSDNCSTQYKSRFVFQCLLVLAKYYNIYVDWFYGEAGHGRGLIDAMAWFGAKGPMRHEIITKDAWFENANEIVQFLKKHFANDNSKEYHYLNDRITAEIRKEGREERKIVGCKASHVITFHPDGKTVKKWLTMKDYFDKEDCDEFVDVNADNDDEKEDEVDEDETEWSQSIDDLDKHDIINVNSFVAIRAPPGSVELFYLMKVKSKDIASEHIVDTSGEHSVLKGEPFLMGNWYSFHKETRKYVQYAESHGIEDAMIHIGEVFGTDVSLNENNQMDIFDYKMLVCSSF